MDCLDLPIKSLILNDLARSLASAATASAPHATSPVAATDALVDRVRQGAQEAADELQEDEMLTMSSSTTHINTSFALFASHLPLSHARSPANIELLLSMLADIARTDFESGLGWADWALPDQLTSAVVGALLKISDVPKEERSAEEQAIRQRVIDGIAQFIRLLDERAQKADAQDLVTHVLPAFNGLYRSFTATPHSFTFRSFLPLSSALAAFLAAPKIDQINALLLASPRPPSDLPTPALRRRQTATAFLSRYRAAGRPLSGNFLLCAGTEMQWTMLSQVLTPSAVFKQPLAIGEGGAEASNLAWDLLLRGAVDKQALGLAEIPLPYVQETAEKAVDMFESMLSTVGHLKAEATAGDLYAYEVLSESLRLATLCSVLLGEPYQPLYSRIKLLLSEHAPVYDTLLQEAALQCLVILVHNYTHLAQPMALYLRRFVATPLPILDVDHFASSEGLSVLSAAAKCLAVCIKTARIDDLISSTMYSLLNYVTTTSKHLGTPREGGMYASSTRSGELRRSNALETMTVHTSAGTVFGGHRTDEARKQVNGSAIAVITHLALEFDQPEVTHITISMLLQRLRGADAHTEAIIVSNLVHLALIAPKADFIDVIKAFSLVSVSANPDDPRYSSAAVLAAQTRLGRELKDSKADLRDAFLVEMLQLFADKGTNVQMLAVANSSGGSSTGLQRSDTHKAKGLGRKETEELLKELTGQLAGLLLPIDAILDHKSFNPQEDASAELVALFRNMWFICVVLDIPKTLKDWHAAALDRIALKTPALILESAADYVSSDLEYNSILRKEFSDVVLSKRRSALSSLIPAQASEIRSFSLPQVTLLATIYEVENRRSKLGRPSYLLAYFCNESLNDSVLAKPLASIASKVINNFKDEVWRASLSHRLDPTLSSEVQMLLVGCTHRFKKVRDVSFSYLSTLLGTFPSLICSSEMVFALLEVLTIMRNSCEEEFTDEYSPVYEHRSDKIDLKLELSDSFTVRNEITTQLYSYARKWLTSAISCAPIEVQTILQRYLSESRDVLLPDSVEMGAGLALHYSKMISSTDRQESSMPNIGGWPSDSANRLASQFAAKNYFAGEHSGLRLVLKQGLSELQQNSPSFSSKSEIAALKSQMALASRSIEDKTSTFSIPDLRRLLFRAAAILVSSETLDHDILHHLVSIPIRAFSPRSVAAGADAWTWLVSERPSAEMALLTEVVAQWTWTIDTRKGLFSTSMNTVDPFTHPIEYSPSDKALMDRKMAAAKKLLTPHLILIQVLSSRFQAVKYQEAGLMLAFMRVVVRSCLHADHMSTHPLAREPRFALLLFGLQMLSSSHLEATLEHKLRDVLFKMGLSWFAVRPQWSYGSNRIQLSAEIKLMQEVLGALAADKIRAVDFVSSIGKGATRTLPGGLSVPEYLHVHGERAQLLKMLIESEINRLAVWHNSLGEPSRSIAVQPERTSEPWAKIVRTAWKVSPALAVHLAERVKLPAVAQEVTTLVRSYTKDAVDVPEALQFLLGETIQANARQNLQWVLLWAPVPPVIAVTYFQPRYESQPLLLQYAMRVLEQYPVQLTFFFVPQVVQALRSDALGYVERFIFETSKVSQLFCHQIIWNMKANTYRDDGATEPDPMKPMLDKMVDRVVGSLSGEARKFYSREFAFFNEVTDISGKLKPFIKKSKPEKKAKIDEEMAKIQVDAGVYLPSNPDGVVVDIDKKSGRPLQSHAKAPFMATFKVRKEKVEQAPAAEDNVIDASDKAEQSKTHYDVWLSAIFKVGDDCRQDVLALQIIAMFKNVFTDVGLALYLYPYRVTATAPGCGVIDVVPNTTSRDELGRAKVNDLLSFFVDEYGGVDTVPFQKARMNFIQSMAAYSVACYILQIKDRHNGNIMIDGDGHIVHIDFGFLFDIGPGGVKFEPNSFKLNHEMVVLMGGRDSQGYRLFQELTVKAFLAIRPHTEQLVETVRLMLATALPSFKGEPTIARLRQRFQPQLTERKAAEYMMAVIRDAHENKRSLVYDEFQRISNGIPYAT